LDRFTFKRSLPSKNMVKEAITRSPAR